MAGGGGAFRCWIQEGGRKRQTKGPCVLAAQPGKHASWLTDAPPLHPPHCGCVRPATPAGRGLPGRCLPGSCRSPRRCHAAQTDCARPSRQHRPAPPCRLQAGKRMWGSRRGQCSPGCQPHVSVRIIPCSWGLLIPPSKQSGCCQGVPGRLRHHIGKMIGHMRNCLGIPRPTQLAGTSCSHKGLKANELFSGPLTHTNISKP